jgi:hypothetical protein
VKNHFAVHDFANHSLFYPIHAIRRLNMS